MKKKSHTLLLLFIPWLFFAQNPRIDSLKASISHQNTLESKAKLYSDIGMEYLKGQVYFDSAFYYTEKSLLIAIEGNLIPQQSRALFNLGNIYTYASNHNLAIEFYEKSVEILIQLGEAEQVAHAYNNIGGSYFELGDYNKAIENYQKSLEFSTLLNDSETIGVCYLNMGEAYFKLDELQESKDLLEKSLSILDSLNINFPSVHLYYAKTLFALNEIEASKYEVNKAYSLSVENNHPFFILEITELLSKIYFKEKDYDNAFRFQQIYWKRKDSLNSAKGLNEIGKLKLRFELDEKNKELNYLKQENKYRLIIYSLVGLGVLLLLILVSRQRKITIMTKEMHNFQKRLIEEELNKREHSKKYKNATAFDAARGLDL